MIGKLAVVLTLIAFGSQIARAQTVTVPAFHVATNGSDSEVYTPITGNPSYVLVFDDEFQGTSLNTTTKWYSPPTNQPDNTYSGYSPPLTVNYSAANVTVHNGCLDMESNYVLPSTYSTAGLTSQGTVTGPGVYWEARVKFPSAFNGQSFDFWTDLSPAYGPTEIDILEFWAPNGYTSNGWNPGSGYGPYSGKKVANPSSKWHVFGTWWTSTAVTFYTDGVQTAQFTNGTNQAARMWHAIINNAICSSTICGGQPSGSTNFSSHFYINYVHVYALNGKAIIPETGYGGPGDNSGAHTTCSGN